MKATYEVEDDIARLRALVGLRLGCWCAPQRCHGDVLIKLIHEWGLEPVEPGKAADGR